MTSFQAVYYDVIFENLKQQEILKPTPIVANNEFDDKIYTPRPSEAVFSSSITSDFKNLSQSDQSQTQDQSHNRPRLDSETTDCGEPSTKDRVKNIETF